MTARPIVIMAPGDVVTLKAQPIVAAQLLRDAGFKVDLQATDWQTVVTRRASQKPPKEGGWNMFFTNWVGADVLNPDRQRFDRRPRQERRLVRLGGKRQDRGAAGTSSRAPPRRTSRRRSPPRSRSKPMTR